MIDTLNVPAVRELADLVEKQKHDGIGEESGFNMSRYRHGCGSPACIAGWALWMEYPGDDFDWVEDVAEEAGKILGIDEYEDQMHLFLGHEFIGDLQKITPSDAAKVLRNLADTKEIDWTIVGYHVDFSKF